MIVGETAIFVESGDIRVRVQEHSSIGVAVPPEKRQSRRAVFSIPTNCPAETYTRVRKCPKKKEA